MPIIFEKEFSLIDLFRGKPKEPFSVNLTIKSEEGKIEELFNKIKDIFTKGLIILSGGSDDCNSLDLKNVNLDHIELMKKHMLSMGISVKFKKYKESDKDFLFRDLLYDIQNIENLTIKVLKDWNTELIEKINISMTINNNNMAPFQIYNRAIRKHFEANHFLKLAKPEVLHDFAIIVKNSKEDYVNVIYFDYAKRSEFQLLHRNLLDNIRR